MVTQSMFYKSYPVYMTFITGIALTILLEGLVQTGGCSIQDMVNFPQPQDVVFRAGKRKARTNGRFKRTSAELKPPTSEGVISGLRVTAAPFVSIANLGFAALALKSSENGSALDSSQKHRSPQQHQTHLPRKRKRFVCVGGRAAGCGPHFHGEKPCRCSRVIKQGLTDLPRYLGDK